MPTASGIPVEHKDYLPYRVATRDALEMLLEELCADSALKQLCGARLLKQFRNERLRALAEEEEAENERYTLIAIGDACRRLHCLWLQLQ